MLKIKLFYLLIIFIFFTSNTFATTWAEIKVPDPILENEECNVQGLASTGSYIYQAASKYELVFSPNTSTGGIWFCEKSGFTAFMNDFEGLTKIEKDAIKKYLKKNPPKDNSIEEKLRLLENVYALRDTKSKFKNRLLRILAHWYQRLENFKKANEYRKLALEDIEQEIKKELPKLQYLEYLYIGMNYSRQLGNNKASSLFESKLKQSFKNLKDENLIGFKSYINEFLEDSKQIKKGNKLEPILTKQSNNN